MPKHDAFSPKAIANKQKLKGLQRLRWYCQMCQKQCRDENGFKCHTMSEGHLRQMRIFAENPNSILDEFSQDFEKGFMDTLSRGHGTKRILANRIYQEYIADKNHVHMNATAWTTLTGFLKYLGKEGKAIVDETEKGWYIQYIDRDPRLLAKQMAADERKQADVDDEDRIRREIEMQVKAAEEEKRRGSGEDAGEGEGGHELDREGLQQKDISLSLAPSVQTKKRVKAAISFGEAEEEEEGGREGPPPKKMTNLALLMREGSRVKK